MTFDYESMANTITDGRQDWQPYHKGNKAKSHTQWQKERRVNNRADALVIAWDGEGINLRGNGRPQTYVLFGCSAEPDNPLVIKSQEQRLSFKDMFAYICDVGSRNPGAIHIGYSFAYDQNMLIQDMPLKWKLRLKDGQWVRWQYNGFTYQLKINWRKRTHIIRYSVRDTRNRISVRIDDIFPSFHTGFVAAYERYFSTRNENWEIVVEGKARRNLNGWKDLNAINYYWRAEILAMGELGTLYRDLLYAGGFAISDFYGPGPIASYIRRQYGLLEHEWGAKEANIPPIVHEAAKSAFYGGRFEQFQMGRIVGPIYSIDINSAYPFALCNIPSLAEGGFWREVETPNEDPNTFGCYLVRYRDEKYINKYNAPLRQPDAQPFPFRDKEGRISYPAITEGWYWRPEVQAVLEIWPERIEIIRGVEWVPATELKPWANVIGHMFQVRKELKSNGDPLEMVYKLAVNSMYGKYAQRVGWDKEKKLPPSSHGLCIAGYTTSYCRAMIWRVCAQISVEHLVAVETDGIYTTVNPALLDLPTGMGKELGQWEVEEWDETLYVQNGVYWLRKSGEWKKAKSRGFSATLVSPESITEYLQSLMPHSVWKPYAAEKKVQQFIGIGSASQWARNGKGNIVPARCNILHCQWIEQTRELIPGGKGKRVHVPAYCDSCLRGYNAYERAHTLLSNHHSQRGLGAILSGEDGTDWDYRSKPHKLPWECNSDYKWREQADDEIERIEIGIDAPTLSV